MGFRDLTFPPLWFYSVHVKNSFLAKPHLFLFFSFIYSIPVLFSSFLCIQSCFSRNVKFCVLFFQIGRFSHWDLNGYKKSSVPFIGCFGLFIVNSMRRTCLEWLPSKVFFGRGESLSWTVIFSSWPYLLFVCLL